MPVESRKMSIASHQPLGRWGLMSPSMDEDSEVKEIAVALSGGGHRATLFSLGVLMALVDLGLNDEVSQIAFVSGGSITNAFVGWRCNFAAADRAEFDAVAKDLIARI